MKALVRDIVKATHDTIGLVLGDDALIASAERAAQCCIHALQAGKKILIAGNGGSASDSQHIAAELVARFNFNRPGLPAIALTTDSSVLTAIGNDFGYDQVFSRQVEALAQPGDVLIALSTSGNSPNIIAALEAATSQKLHTIGFTGRNGGKMAGLCEITLKIPSSVTQHIQECHIMFGHILCQMIEEAIFGAEYKKKNCAA